jgi:putative oxidoreductase
MKFTVLLGRILFASIFLMSITHIFNESTVEQAASHDVPMASVLVRIAGVLAIAGSLSVILGYKARLGAWLIVLFLVPVTFFMHNFWTISDPMMRMMQQINFMKNISMLGGALLITYFGAGPLSIDSRKPQTSVHT